MNIDVDTLLSVLEDLYKKDVHAVVKFENNKMIYNDKTIIETVEENGVVISNNINYEFS